MRSTQKILLAALIVVLLGGAGWLACDEHRGGRYARLAGSDEAEDRLAAVAGLGGRRSGLARRTLTALTGDSDPRVAAAAVRALGEFGDPDSRRHLAQVLANGDSGRARGAAAAALAEHGGIDDDTLAETLLHDRDPEARAGAALGFGRRRDPAALPHLLKALADPEASVRVRAITAMNRILIVRLPFQADAPEDARRRQAARIRALLASKGLLGTPSTTRPSGGGED